MCNHRVAHEIGRTDFNSNAIIAEHGCHCVDNFEGEPTSVLDGAAVVVCSVVEVTDPEISRRLS
jgi:hypothetical protein